MSNIFETGKAMSLHNGQSSDGVEGSGQSYELILETLGIFDILETMQMGINTDLYTRSYEFID
jgi:hypothetical protein